MKNGKKAPHAAPAKKSVKPGDHADIKHKAAAALEHAAPEDAKKPAAAKPEAKKVAPAKKAAPAPAILIKNLFENVY